MENVPRTRNPGIDVAIGVLEMTGLGLGPVIIREFLKQFVFRNPAVCAVITDPEESNFRSLRAFKKAGFSVVKTVHLVGEDKRRQVVRLERPRSISVAKPQFRVEE